MSLIGLDYPAVISVAKIYGIEITADIFSQIQALEHDVLLMQNEKLRNQKNE